ncbi:hypothetical protein FRB99_003804 [Tulasnella sp. 403]|nr:hypothetical protein FRB99_003804 [Tulasnella sp. 403]
MDFDSFSVSPKGTWAVTCSTDGTLQIVNLKAGVSGDRLGPIGENGSGLIASHNLTKITISLYTL